MSDSVKTFSLTGFKYASLFFSIFLIVLGSMSVYEGQLSPADDRTQNVGLIIVAVLTLLITALFEMMLIYVAKEDTNLTFPQLYMAFGIITFGIIVAVVALVCAVDVPNVNGRGTLLWVIGAIAVIAGVIGTILSSLYIAKSFGVKQLNRLP